MITTEEPKIEGIIVRTYPYGESDIICRVITSARGKACLIAKHARSSKKRFPSSLDIFDSGIFEVKNGKGSMHVILSFKPRAIFRRTRENLDKLVAASVLCESFDLLVHEEFEGGLEYFETLSLGLQAIEESDDLKEIMRALFLSLRGLLSYSGFFRPETELGPSANNLLLLLNKVEESAEKELTSKTELGRTIQRMRG